MTNISTMGKFEECADELNDFVATLGRYPHTVLAFALRTHLSALLQALLANGRWTRAEVAIFLQELCDETVEDAGHGPPLGVPVGLPPKVLFGSGT